MEPKCFTIACWNIQGLRSFALGTKCRDKDFLRDVGDCDVIILQETWSRGEESTGCPPGYREIIIPSTKLKGVSQGRESGGMIIWYKAYLTQAIETVKIGEYHIWLRIKKDTITLKESIFLCALYIPPSESPYFKEDCFLQLEEEISHYQTLGKILVCGDINARTGTVPDIVSNQGNKYIPNFNFPEIQNQPRKNYDKIVNQNGRQLLQLCRSLGLYIINGRMKGDPYGRYTHCSHLGSSTVDYMLTDIERDHLQAFTVSPLSPLSDHSRITLYIKQDKVEETIQVDTKLHRAEQPYRWGENSKEQYQQAFCNDGVKALINTFITKFYTSNKDGVNLAVKDINIIFDRLAVLANLKKSKIYERKNSISNKKWFDKECKDLRRNLRKLSNQKHRDPNNNELRQKYWETHKEYNYIIRAKKTQHIKHQLNEMEEAIDSNKFWENWKQLNKPEKDELAIQNGDIWTEHFRKMYEPTILNPTRTEILEKLKTIEPIIKDQQNPIDFPITEKELELKVNALQPKKACGVDGILNEMIKFADNRLHIALVKLFNLVLSTGHFPDIWNQGLITPIFKNGDKLDPNNYRGICVGSNMGKIFCSIINTRLQYFLEDHDILRKSQIGFVKNCRTTDHIYTLHTLIEKHVNQNKSKIFSCFVDFEKAFDSIWHEGLLLQLLQNGIGGKTYDVIKTMYTNNKCAVKINNKRTNFFSQRRGVMQGNSLSPTLFNIYINQLAKTLDESSAPGLILNNAEIKCLLYADDLVLLSNSKEGLQQLIDLLQEFCQTWALKVNMKKTKIMVFQKRSHGEGNEPQFMLGQTTIEHTKTYTYLGLKISHTGNFNAAVNELREKARRAFYAIRKSTKINIPIPIWLKIFKTVIQPIALYGSEIWGQMTNQDYSNWDKHKMEIFHTEFCKYLLKVQRKTPNNACRAELGQFPLLFDIQKRSISFYNHLITSDTNSYHHLALKSQEQKIERSALHQLVLRLTDTNPPLPQNIIQPKETIAKQKEKYITYWQNTTKTQSKLECYLALKREYILAEYLTTITEPKLRKTLTKYRISDHRLAVETGRHRQTWRPREDRQCSLCSQGEVETEIHFLLHCDAYKEIRESYFPKIYENYTDINSLPDEAALPYLLGEKSQCATLAARYVSECQRLRDNQWTAES